MTMSRRALEWPVLLIALSVSVLAGCGSDSKSPPNGSAVSTGTASATHSDNTGPISPTPANSPPPANVPVTVSAPTSGGDAHATAPPAPSHVTAASGNSTVGLSWGAAAGATTYHVKRGLAAGGPYIQVAAPAAAGFKDGALTNGTRYYYVVSSVGTAGESGDSAEVEAMPMASPGSAPHADVTVTVSAAKTHAISPYIYGTNDYAGTAKGQTGLTLDRAGGNRWTAYNWETNASNAGSDYLYENDNYLTSSTHAGDAVSQVIASDRAQNMATLVTFQMQGLVAADENGPVNVGNSPDMARFKIVVDQKSSKSGIPFTSNPPASDPNVYMDEFITSLDHAFAGQNIFGASPASRPVFAQLDNEPELWNSTHAEVQGRTGISSDTFIAKTISLSKALKTQFSSLVVFGPVHYGFQGIYNWQGELASTPSGSNWFPDKYLAALKAASGTFGTPLVDVYDFHWYSEATDGSGHRAVDLNGADLTPAQVQAIVQSPRSLWDPGYTENSWITQELGGPIFIIGRLQEKIAAILPGMKISITEYNNGGGNHIAGTIAQADNLGIFGAQGLFAATYWALNNSSPYILGGFAAFRDFDGANANFGDTSLQTVSSNNQNIAVYASTDSNRPGRVVCVAINRSTSPQVTAIVGQPLSGTAHLYQMTAATAKLQSKIKPVPAGTMAVSGTSLTVTLPPLSVTSIDIY